MTIGVDLSVLQTAHRMRGIGSTIINFINQMSPKVKKKYNFVFYINPVSNDESSPLELLNLEGITYEIRELETIKQINFKLPRLVGKIVNKSLRYLQFRKTIWFGDKRINDLTGIDYFLQFDQHQPLPLKRKVKSAIFAYDIIPYILESDYLWSYETARKRGCSIKGSLRHSLRRRQYRMNTKLIMKKAHKIIAISNTTKNDLIDHIGVKSSTIRVCLLGVSDQIAEASSRSSFNQYVSTSWGYIPKGLSLENENFLLFIGGADPRRKLIELVAAFKNLRARGYDFKLILAGDTMYGPSTLPNIELQNYLFNNTSYNDDIYFMGFVDNNQRHWLYSHASYFIFPSVYEGFGLPILEAMQYGVPVITYRNSSITEVADIAALYSTNYKSIIEAVAKLENNPSLRKKHIELGKKQAAKFRWSNTIEKVLDSMVS